MADNTKKRNRRNIALKQVQDGKHIDNFLIFAVCLVVLVLSVGSFLLPDKEKSDNENRYLTQAPEFDIEDILDGSYEEQLEEYMSDQIIGRENWIKIMSTVSTSLGAKDINGVYILKDGRLIERKTQAEFNSDRFRRNLENVAAFKEELEEEDINVKALLVPTAAYSYGDEFNASTNFDEEAYLDLAGEILGDSYIEFRNELRPDKDHPDGYYYRTDHHWNYDGAYKGAQTYLEAIGIKPGDYTPETLSEDFLGTLYSKVLLSKRVRDDITIPSETKDMDLKVTIDDEEYDSVYFMDKLENKDKYEVFFGGNYDRVDIMNRDNASGQKLMVVKDSYANSFVPFILKDFSEITLIDTRYFRDSVKDLAIEGEYDQVLILYSVPNFSEEKLNLNTSAIQ